MNESIQKYNANKVLCNLNVNGSEYKYLEEKQTWNLPECVEKLILGNVNFDLDNIQQREKIDDNHSEKVKQMIREGQYQIPIEMSNLSHLKLVWCKHLRLENQFTNLQQVHN